MARFGESIGLSTCSALVDPDGLQIRSSKWDQLWPSINLDRESGADERARYKEIALRQIGHQGLLTLNSDGAIKCRAICFTPPGSV